MNSVFLILLNVIYVDIYTHEAKLVMSGTMGHGNDITSSSS